MPVAYTEFGGTVINSIASRDHRFRQRRSSGRKSVRGSRRDVQRSELQRLCHERDSATIFGGLPSLLPNVIWVETRAVEMGAASPKGCTSIFGCALKCRVGLYVEKIITATAFTFYLPSRWRYTTGKNTLIESLTSGLEARWVRWESLEGFHGVEDSGIPVRWFIYEIRRPKLELRGREYSRSSAARPLPLAGVILCIGACAESGGVAEEILLNAALTANLAI